MTLIYEIFLLSKLFSILIKFGNFSTHFKAVAYIFFLVQFYVVLGGFDEFVMPSIV